MKLVQLMALDATEFTFQSLQIAAAPGLDWCSGFITDRPEGRNVSEVFRSPELSESAQQVFPDSCHTRFSDSIVIAFNEFLARRRELTIARPRSTLNTVFGCGPGVATRELVRQKSLLVTDWTASLFDGALSPETEGFIDESAMPPWDTWLCLLQVSDSHGQVCLLSWVPHWLADKVDFAIRVDAAECLSWLIVGDNEELQLHGWGKCWQAGGVPVHGH
ncbi:MAG: hypothetical protein EXS05_00445 [Planctomycetaceae bacterium]|nr:hypothetical protein [Planctomycetaceae bacterium]